ncbi:MAG: 5'/3'-nucleotidase SurE [Ilumatobacteraceae bacterium]
MRLRLVSLLAVGLVLVSCSSKEESELPSTGSIDASVTTPAPSTAAPTSVESSTPDTTAAPTTTAVADPLTILVTNDDGVSAPGIDALVTALSALPDVEVVVVAPAANQSGTSDSTTPGGVSVQDATTVSGHPAVAVDGFPADAVNYALDQLGLQPDVVVSGVNAGQNIGTFVPLSGTIGAARVAARRGVPAIAISAGGLSGTDFATGAKVAADEVTALRGSLGWGENTDQTVVNLNTPTCAAGTSIRGVEDVPVATAFPPGTNGLDLTFDCASTATDPADDAVALTIGFASRSIVAADLTAG